MERLDVSVGLWSAGVDAAVSGSQLLEGEHEIHAAELVAVIAEHPLQLPAGGLQLFGDTLGELCGLPRGRVALLADHGSAQA